MPEPATLFTPWESFYVIVGSSSAALTGLMFVVVSLIPGSNTGGSGEAIDAFATPNVVHFCFAFVVSAILTAPWHGPRAAGALLGLAGAAGVAYVAIVIRRTRRQTDYKPVFEDIWWHMILPLVAYVTIAGSAWKLVDGKPSALFAIATAVLTLLFCGIHNAWDTVTYVAARKMQAEREATHRKHR